MSTLLVLQLVLGLRRTSVSGVIYVRDAMQAGDDRRTRGATGGRTRRQTPATTETAGDCCARTCGAQSSEQACIDTHQRVSCADATAEATTYVPSRSSCASVADCVFETERGREGGREKERERESVCVCVFGDSVRVRDLPSRARHSQSCPYPSRACCDASCGCFWDQRNAKNAAPSGHDGLAGRCMERTRGQQSGRNVDIITIFIPVFTGAYEREVLIMRRLVTHALNLHCCSRPFDCIVGLLLAATAQPESTPHPGGHATRLARRANQCGGRRDCA